MNGPIPVDRSKPVSDHANDTFEMREQDRENRSNERIKAHLGNKARVMSRLHVRRISGDNLRTLSTAGVSYFGMALSLVSAPMLARALGADGRGVLAGIFAALQVLSWVAFMGVPRGAIVSGGQNGDIPRRATPLLFAYGTASAIALFVSAPMLSGGSQAVETGIRATSWILIFSGTAQLGSEHLQATSRFLWWNVHRSITLIVPSILIIVLFLFDRLTIQNAVTATAAGQIAWAFTGTAVALYLVRSSVRGKLLAWRFCAGYWFATFFNSVGSRLDQVFLTATAATAQVGVYAVAVTCAGASGALTQAIGHVAFPKFLKTEENGRQNIYKRNALMGMATSSLSGVLVVAALHFFGKALLGPTYEGIVALTAVLVIYQALFDQWQLVVYRDSAGGTSYSISVISAISVSFLAMMLLALKYTDSIDSLSVAIAMTIFGLIRIGLGFGRGSLNALQHNRA